MRNMRNFLINLAKDISIFTRNKKYIKKVYIEREQSSLKIYFFVEGFENFPQNTYEFEQELQSKYQDFEFDTKIIPYYSRSVEKYAESYDLIPVLS